MATCPGCHAPVADDQVVCVSCGLNLGTGKALSTSTSGDSDPAAAPAGGLRPARNREGPARLGWGVPTAIREAMRRRTWRMLRYAL